MAFQEIPVVEKYQFYLDVAFSRGKATTAKLRSSIKGIDRIDKSKKMEHARIDTIKDALVSRLNKILEGFPSIDGLTPFYNELVRITLDYKELKMSLGSVNWACQTITRLSKDYTSKLMRCQTTQQVTKVIAEYHGRISSILKEINKNLKYLIIARKIIVNFPVIKQMPTIAIAGFPNVGKSTLLSKMTRAKPEIKDYAFTTKGLNLGYTTINKKKVQMVDTPGTLARPDKMNEIELQAYLAMKIASDVLVYVWDVTEPYPMKDQERLFKAIKKFKKPVIEYASKGDIADKEKFKELVSKRKGITVDKKELKVKLQESI